MPPNLVPWPWRRQSRRDCPVDSMQALPSQYLRSRIAQYRLRCLYTGYDDREMAMDVFLHENPVFSVQALVESDIRISKQAIYKRLRYLEHTGRVTAVVRGVYAVVPAGQRADTLQPDPFLVFKLSDPTRFFVATAPLNYKESPILSGTSSPHTRMVRRIRAEQQRCLASALGRGRDDRHSAHGSVCSQRRWGRGWRTELRKGVAEGRSAPRPHGCAFSFRSACRPWRRCPWSPAGRGCRDWPPRCCGRSADRAASRDRSPAGTAAGRASPSARRS